MRQINPVKCILWISVIFIISCSDNANRNAAAEADTASVTQSHDTAASMPAYDPTLDPVTTAGKLAKKVADSLGIRMYEFAVKPGESWGIHRHPDHTVYVLQGGVLALYRQEEGKQDTLTFPTGAGLVSGPLTDSGRNVGKTTIRMVVTDIYRPRPR